ncbi:MAG: hypothetical protein JWP48_3508 [Actinoallomurus sp.]|nr:hypothetical protein [Actinoallomurus sp.]
MLLSLVHRLIRSLLGFLAVIAGSDVSKDVELLVLRQENQVLMISEYRHAAYALQLPSAVLVGRVGYASVSAKRSICAASGDQQ